MNLQTEALALLKLRGPGGKLLLLSGNDSKTNETAVKLQKAEYLMCVKLIYSVIHMKNS